MPYRAPGPPPLGPWSAGCASDKSPSMTGSLGFLASHEILGLAWLGLAWLGWLGLAGLAWLAWLYWLLKLLELVLLMIAIMALIAIALIIAS